MMIDDKGFWPPDDDVEPGKGDGGDPWAVWSLLVTSFIIIALCVAGIWWAVRAILAAGVGAGL